MHPFQFLYSFMKHLLCGGRPFFGFGFFEHFLHFRHIFSAQFIFDGLELLLEKIITLLFVEFRPRLVGEFGLKFGILKLRLHEVHQ